MSYSEDFRKRTIEYLHEGHTYQETSKAFKVSPNTINTWVKKNRETGSLKVKKREYKSKLDRVMLQGYMNSKPDAYQSEIAKHFNCSISTVCRGLKQIGFTRKKRVSDTKNKILLK